MNHPPEIVHGGNWQAIIGGIVSSWQWLAGDANGATVLLTIASLILAVLKIVDACRKWAWANEFMGESRPILRKIRDAVTRPQDLE